MNPHILSTMPAVPQGNTFCGDLLISPSVVREDQGRNLQTISEPGCWQLDISPASASWNGYPFAFFRNGGWNVWIVGDLYGIPDGRTREGFISGILNRITPASELNGHFLLWAWNNQSRQWHVYTSRFGTLHGYFCKSERGGAMGTYFPAVAAAASNRQLNWDGLAGFFYCGFFMGDLTWYKDIRTFSPASHYVFDEHLKEISCTRYWNWEGVGDSDIEYIYWLEDFSDLLQRVLKEQTAQGRTAVPISGGLDSRCTIAALGPKAPGLEQVWTYGYGFQEHSVETAIAAQVAKAYGYEFQKHTITACLFEKLDLILSSLEGFQEISMARQASFYENLQQKADYVISAHWGDVWCDHMHLPEGASGWNEKEFVQFALKKMGKGGRVWLLEHLCRQNGINDPAEPVSRQVSEALDKVSHIPCPDYRIKAFKTDNWSHRWTTTSLRIYQAAAFPKLPFYDTRISDCLSRIPRRYHAGRLFQINYLKKFAPTLAGIRWQVYDANLYTYKYYRSLLLPRRIISKLKRTFTFSPHIQRNWEIQLSGSAAQTGINRLLLEKGLDIHGFAEKKDIEALIGRFKMDPHADKTAETLLMLLSFSAWLEFMKKKPER